jgi:hypothetical protein
VVAVAVAVILTGVWVGPRLAGAAVSAPTMSRNRVLVTANGAMFATGAEAVPVNPVTLLTSWVTL